MIAFLPKTRPYRVTRFVEGIDTATGKTVVIPVITGVVLTGSSPGKYKFDEPEAGFWGWVKGRLRHLCE